MYNWSEREYQKTHLVKVAELQNTIQIEFPTVGINISVQIEGLTKAGVASTWCFQWTVFKNYNLKVNKL